MSSGLFSIPKDLLGCFSISAHQQRPAALLPTSSHANSPHLVPVTQRDRVRFKKNKKSRQSIRQREQRSYSAKTEPTQRWPHGESDPGAELGTRCEHVSINSTRKRFNTSRTPIIKPKVYKDQMIRLLSGVLRWILMQMRTIRTLQWQNAGGLLKEIRGAAPP